MFQSFLTYKLDWAGGRLEEVPAPYTSLTCPAPECGHISSKGCNKAPDGRKESSAFERRRKSRWETFAMTPEYSRLERLVHPSKRFRYYFQAGG